MKRIHFFIAVVILVCNYTMQGQTTDKYQKSTDWWEPDTVIVYDTSGNMGRIIYTYTHNGYLEILLSQRFSENQWNDSSRTVYTFDGSNNILTSTTQFWSDSQWKELSKDIYTYDNNNNLLTHIAQLNQQNQRKDTYEYDGKNNLIKDFYQYWRNGEWEYSNLNTEEYNSYVYNEKNLRIYMYRISRIFNGPGDTSNYYIYTYNEDNQLVEELSFNYYNDQWNNSSKLTYTYDTNGNLLEYIQMSWNNNQWREFYRHTYRYDEKNNCLTMVYQYAGDTTSRTTYTYDDRNNLLTSWAEAYRYGIVDTSNQLLTIYTYDEHNNQLTELTQNRKEGQWANNVFRSWEYDENSNAISNLYQIWSVTDEDWINMNTTSLRIYYNNMESSIVGYRGYRVTASYTKLAKTGIVSLPARSISVFPNPALSQFTVTNVENANLQLYNMAGQEVFRTYSKEERMVIPIDFLPQGVYLLKVEKDSFSTVHKVQVVK